MSKHIFEYFLDGNTLDKNGRLEKDEAAAVTEILRISYEAIHLVRANAKGMDAAFLSGDDLIAALEKIIYSTLPEKVLKKLKNKSVREKIEESLKNWQVDEAFNNCGRIEYQLANVNMALLLTLANLDRPKKYNVNKNTTPAKQAPQKQDKLTKEIAEIVTLHFKQNALINACDTFCNALEEKIAKQLKKIETSFLKQQNSYFHDKDFEKTVMIHSAIQTMRDKLNSELYKTSDTQNEEIIANVQKSLDHFHKSFNQEKKILNTNPDKMTETFLSLVNKELGWRPFKLEQTPEPKLLSIFNEIQLCSPNTTIQVDKKNKYRRKYLR